MKIVLSNRWKPSFSTLGQLANYLIVIWICCGCGKSEQAKKSEQMAVLLKSPSKVVMPVGYRAGSEELANYIYWTEFCNILDAIDSLPQKPVGFKKNTFPRLVGSMSYSITAERLRVLNDTHVDEATIIAVRSTRETLIKAQQFFDEGEWSEAKTMSDGAISGATSVVKANPISALKGKMLKGPQLSDDFQKLQRQLDGMQETLERHYGNTNMHFHRALLPFAE